MADEQDQQTPRWVVILSIASAVFLLMFLVWAGSGGMESAP